MLVTAKLPPDVGGVPQGTTGLCELTTEGALNENTNCRMGPSMILFGRKKDSAGATGVCENPETPSAAAQGWE